MAVIEAILGLAFIALLMYWPHFFIKNEEKREFAGTCLAVPIACVIITAVLLIAKC